MAHSQFDPASSSIVWVSIVVVVVVGAVRKSIEPEMETKRSEVEFVPDFEVEKM